MMELFIDGQRCDIEKIPAIPIGFDAQKLSSVEGERVGRTIEIELPVTPKNEQLFRFAQDLYATSRFNSEHHIATVKRNDVVVFEGTAHLAKSWFGKGGGGLYTLRICEGGAGWVEKVVYSKLSELPIPFKSRLNLSTISKSWTGEEAVRFLPVWRSEKGTGFSISTPVAVEHVLLTDDYHPFISISEMVRAMFADTGYTLHSDFLDSGFGQSLYMSGDYERSDISRAKEMCDFFARRIAPVTTTADFFGRVYTSQSVAAHSIGAIVDLPDPEAVDSNGVQMIETFNTLNAISKSSEGALCFTPQCSVKAGFLLHLEYTTEYEVVSRDTFRGFNLIEGVNGVKVEFPLANTYTDYKQTPKPNMQYRAMVFDHLEGRNYQLVTLTPRNTLETVAMWSSRSMLVDMPAEQPKELILYYRDSDSGAWDLYEEDWALYAGYLNETGFVDVVLDLRLPAQDIASGESYVIDKFWFGGAAAGMQLTIGTNTSLRPYFTTVPGYDTLLEFKDIAPRNVTQAELLTAIGEMFNLVFYTDKERKEVYIEPLENFYEETEIVDWTTRIDYTEGVCVEDAGIDTPQIHSFASLDADRATHQFNLDNDTELGSWSHCNPLYGTKSSVSKRGDSLFTPTINSCDILGYAPSASLMKVGDVGAEEGLDIAFTPHIVCYKGMRALPNGECWLAGEKLSQYPYAAFFDDEEINLCFEERNGIEGLNRYYRPHLQRLCEAQIVTLDLCLSTAEIASLLTANGPLPSLRKLFRLNLRGESSLYRLVGVEGWREHNTTVRCRFLRLLKDGLCTETTEN